LGRGGFGDRHINGAPGVCKGSRLSSSFFRGIRLSWVSRSWLGFTCRGGLSGIDNTSSLVLLEFFDGSNLALRLNFFVKHFKDVDGSSLALLLAFENKVVPVLLEMLFKQIVSLLDGRLISLVLMLVLLGLLF